VRAGAAQRRLSIEFVPGFARLRAGRLALPVSRFVARSVVLYFADFGNVLAALGCVFGVTGVLELEC
jgi:hypothetical protein